MKTIICGYSSREHYDQSSNLRTPPSTHKGYQISSAPWRRFCTPVLHLVLARCLIFAGSDCVDQIQHLIANFQKQRGKLLGFMCVCYIRSGNACNLAMTNQKKIVCVHFETQRKTVLYFTASHHVSAESDMLDGQVRCPEFSRDFTQKKGSQAGVLHLSGISLE